MGFEKEAPATSAQADNVVTRDRDRHLPHIPNPKAIKTPSDRRERTQRDPLKVKETIKEISGLDESEPLSPIGPGTFRRTVTGLKVASRLLDTESHTHHFLGFRDKDAKDGKQKGEVRELREAKDKLPKSKGQPKEIQEVTHGQGTTPQGNVPTQGTVPTVIPKDIGKLHEQLLERLDKGGWKQLNEPEDVGTWISSLGEWAVPLEHSLNQTAPGAKYPTLLHHILVYKSENGRNTKFKKRKMLARHLMREYPGLYERMPKEEKHIEEEDDEDDDDDDDEDEVEEDEKTPLYVALTKAITIDKKNSEPTIDPFLQLFVTENPRETITQLEQWHSDDGDREGGPRLHDLLPRIWSPDTDGLTCMVKILPHLGPKLLANKNREGNTVLHSIAKHSLNFDPESISKSELFNEVVGTIQRSPKAVSTTNAASESPYLHRVNLAQKRNMSFNDPITAYLKKRCIAYHPEVAFQLLYGVGPSTQRKRIFLDLIGLENREFSETRLKRFLDWLNPDDVLKYIRIPHFVVTKTDKPHNPNARNQPSKSSSSSSGRSLERPNHCQIIFHHLRTMKPNAVSTILDVAVDDMSGKRSPYTNETIITCLQSFKENIEKWDWRKIDMCSDAVFAAAPNAKDLYLYSSGNNAVLKSWASLDGLPKFSNLEQVHLKICKAYVVEEKSSIEKSVESFKEKLQENFRIARKRTLTSDRIKIDISELKDMDQHNITQAMLIQTQMPKQDVHILPANSWLSKMEKFARFINDAPTPDHEPRRIKVAVLDDGFDLVDHIDEFAENNIVGKAFNGSNNQTAEEWSGRFPNVEYFSEGGHGTLMAQLIRKICPKVDFYMAKLQNTAKSPDQDGKAYGPTTESAVAAINWAIENQVHVMSMSWTVKLPDERSALQDALDNASKAGILLFGAYSDQGHNLGSNAVLYPAMHNKVFCIGAADSSGNLDKHVGYGADYAFPGGDNDAKCEGSSFATALAAGLAALILHCAEYIDYGEDEELRDALRQHLHMNKVFERMLAQGTKYISVANYFNEKLLHHGWDYEGKMMFANMVKNILAPFSTGTGHIIS